MRDAEVYAGAAVIGAVAGLRSLSAPTIVGRLARSGAAVPNASLGFLEGPNVSRALTVFAVGEAIADKLPFIPRRTQTGSLIFRAISGGLSGAALCSAKKRSAVAGAVIGLAAAVGATYGAYELRRRTVKRLHIPDWPVALIEDAITAGCGALLISRLGDQPRHMLT